MIKIVQEGEIVHNIGPFRMKGGDGTYVLYMSSGIPIGNNHEEITKIAITLRDVSEAVGDDSDTIAMISLAN